MRQMVLTLHIQWVWHYSDDMMDDYKLRTRTDAVTKTGLSHLVLITDISGEVQAGDPVKSLRK